MLKVNNIKVEPLPRREHRQLRITLGGKRERGAVKKRQSLFFFHHSSVISSPITSWTYAQASRIFLVKKKRVISRVVATPKMFNKTYDGRKCYVLSFPADLQSFLMSKSIQKCCSPCILLPADLPTLAMMTDWKAHRA